jgi:hypothetical protein
MGLIQTAFDFFAPTRPTQYFDAGAERTRKERLLEQRLSELLGSSVALTTTDNARTMLSARQHAGVAEVRLHHMFVDADETTLKAVARYLAGGHSSASLQLQRFIKQNRERIRVRQPRRARVATEVKEAPDRGQHHDLPSMFAQLNDRYFGREVEARIIWGRSTQGLGRQGRRRSIKLGSYSGREPLIRVHPVLDATWVPSFFVEYIVYHEMLHHVVAMPVRNGRRSLHGREFRARERAFERYTDAIAWERANLDRLLSG